MKQAIFICCLLNRTYFGHHFIHTYIHTHTHTQTLNTFLKNIFFFSLFFFLYFCCFFFPLLNAIRTGFISVVSLGIQLGLSSLAILNFSQALFGVHYIHTHTLYLFCNFIQMQFCIIFFPFCLSFYLFVVFI